MENSQPLANAEGRREIIQTFQISYRSNSLLVQNPVHIFTAVLAGLITDTPFPCEP